MQTNPLNRHRPRRRLALRAGLAGALLLSLSAADAAPPSEAQKCTADQLTAAGKFVACRLKAEAVATRTGDTDKRTAALARCAAQLGAAFLKSTDKYGPACPAVEPPADFETFLSQCADQTTSAGGGGVFGGGGGSSCGDGAITVEACDGADLGGQSCGSLGFAQGTLACDAACGLDTSACVAPTCGDGVVNVAGEQCDGGDLAGQTCASSGHGTGAIGCAADCTLDVSACVDTRCCQIAALSTPITTSKACVDFDAGAAVANCSEVAGLIPGTALAPAGTQCSGATGLCGAPPPQSPGVCCELTVNRYGIDWGDLCAENGSATDCGNLDAVLDLGCAYADFGYPCGSATAHPGAVCRLAGAGPYGCVAP